MAVEYFSPEIQVECVFVHHRFDHNSPQYYQNKAVSKQLQCHAMFSLQLLQQYLKFEDSLKDLLF